MADHSNDDSVYSDSEKDIGGSILTTLSTVITGGAAAIGELGGGVNYGNFIK